MDPKAATKAEGFNLISFRQFQDHVWTYRHDISKESERSVYLIDVKNNKTAPCPLAVTGTYENLDLQKLNWSSSVNILQGKYTAPTIYLLEKNELGNLNKLNSMYYTAVISANRGGVSLNYYSLPGRGIIVSPFKKLSLAPQVQELLGKKNSAMAKMIHGIIPKQVISNDTARKDEPNVWELNIPDLFPITAESGSLSSAL